MASWINRQKYLLLPGNIWNIWNHLQQQKTAPTAGNGQARIMFCCATAVLNWAVAQVWKHTNFPRNRNERRNAGSAPCASTWGGMSWRCGSQEVRPGPRGGVLNEGQTTSPLSWSWAWMRWARGGVSVPTGAKHFQIQAAIHPSITQALGQTKWPHNDSPISLVQSP